MKELIKRLRTQAKLTKYYCPTAAIPTLEENAADAIEKLNTWNDELLKEVAWLRSCKNCKIYSECPRHGSKTVHGCDHWVDACGERRTDE